VKEMEGRLSMALLKNSGFEKTFLHKIKEQELLIKEQTARSDQMTNQVKISLVKLLSHRCSVLSIKQVEAA
jgi:hypothetical protein